MDRELYEAELAQRRTLLEHEKAKVDALGAEVERLREAIVIQARDYEEARIELQAEVDRLRADLEAAHLRRIEAQNPGIDLDEVKRRRAVLAQVDEAEKEVLDAD